jgi:phospholipid/cholesterol/gamma-HCH transport system substrate-binding protein
MKISNETKVGILAITSLVLLILGFNFLKGKSLFKKNKHIYVRVTDLRELKKSNEVFLNGFLVGTVYEIKPLSDNIDNIIVTVHLAENINIPANSTASIEATLIGNIRMILHRGDTNYFIRNAIPVKYLHIGDTMQSGNKPDMLGALTEKLDPTLLKVNGALDSLKMIIGNLNSVLDPNTKGNLQSVIANLLGSSVSLQKILNTETGALAKTLNNTQSITANFAKNNEQINKTMQNIETATSKLANLKVEETISSLNKSIEQLNGIVAKANSKDGSLGKLLNDPGLYNNLNSTVIKVQTLMDDLRLHPKRYTGNIIFNRKDKTGPLTSPTVIDSVKAP